MRVVAVWLALTSVSIITFLGAMLYSEVIDRYSRVIERIIGIAFISSIFLILLLLTFMLLTGILRNIRAI